MADYHHHVSGFFAHRDEAQKVFLQLANSGLPLLRLHIFDANTLAPSADPSSGSNEVLKDVIVDGAIGVGVGGGLGLLAEIALVAADVTLFVASPLIAPLAMLGWGASLGGVIGAVAGASSKEGKFADLVQDAIASGQVVVVADTLTALESLQAAEIIKAAVGECKDVAAP